MELTDEIISKLQAGDPNTVIRLRMYIVELFLQNKSYNPNNTWVVSDAKEVLNYVKDGKDTLK
jgi:hypothetical protein